MAATKQIQLRAGHTVRELEARAGLSRYYLLPGAELPRCQLTAVPKCCSRCRRNLACGPHRHP